jgi:hypothetical protein
VVVHVGPGVLTIFEREKLCRSTSRYCVWQRVLVHPCALVTAASSRSFPLIRVHRVGPWHSGSQAFCSAVHACLVAQAYAGGGSSAPVTASGNQASSSSGGESMALLASPLGSHIPNGRRHMVIGVPQNPVLFVRCQCQKDLSLSFFLMVTNLLQAR